MRKWFCLLALLLCAVVPGGAACGEGGRLRVVATLFPEYDWVREVLGDVDADLTLLVKDGVDLHSYQPTVDDIIRIAGCDLFLYEGGESDEWVEEALKNTVNGRQVALSLLDILGSSAKDEEVVEGMEHHHEEAEADEHVWLSLRNAKTFCRRIARTLSDLDPNHGETYAANAARYIAALSALDGRYQAVVDGADRRVLLFGDRFPFRYLVDDYGLEYYAAFPGCSAETEASFATILFLSGKVDALGLPCVLTLEGRRHRIAETVVANTKAKDQRILSMDSMQSTTLGDVQKGVTYLSVMERNLETLKAALD